MQSCVSAERDIETRPTPVNDGTLVSLVEFDLSFKMVCGDDA